MSKPMTDEQWLGAQIDAIGFAWTPAEIQGGREYFDALAAGDGLEALHVRLSFRLTPVDLLLMRAQIGSFP